jgi:hypothetical protein
MQHDKEVIQKHQAFAGENTERDGGHTGDVNEGGAGFRAGLAEHTGACGASDTVSACDAQFQDKEFIETVLGNS